MLTFKTSYGTNAIALKLVGNDMLITDFPRPYLNGRVMFIVTDEADRQLDQKVMDLREQKRLTFPRLADGKYYLDVYVPGNGENFWSFVPPQSIALVMVNGRLHFVDVKTINNNWRLMAKLPYDAPTLKGLLKPSWGVDCEHPDIVALARRLTQFKLTPLQKMQAVHDWVAAEMYYDYDALNDRSYLKTDYTASKVMKAHKCVCQGYANLTAALLRAAGVPAFVQRCYALALTTDGGWEKPENMSNESNHVITAAFDKERWVMMDVTWDSDNAYVDGRFKRRTGRGPRRIFFDATIEFISNTHRFEQM